MPAREINPFTARTRIRSQFLRTQSSASGHDYASDRSAIGAGWVWTWAILYGHGLYYMDMSYII